MRKLLAILMLCCPAWATTYYISSSAGSDTNTSTQAQSKSTPWAHFRGMANASSNAASFTPVAGTTFVLMGCDSWLNASFPITWSWSGSAGNPITITDDPTWYNTSVCPSAWGRPIFDAGTTIITGTRNVFASLNSISYVTLDNVEMKNFFWDSASCTAQSSCGYSGLNYITTQGSNHVTLSNLYMHAWNHGTGASSLNCMLVLGDTNSPYDSGSLFTQSVVDGSDSTNGGDSCSATYAFPSSTYNVIHDLSNGLLPSVPAAGAEVAYNLIYNIHTDFSGAHENSLAVETVQSAGATIYVHDNVIHDSCCAAHTGESLYFGYPNAFTAYAWNNLIYNNSQSNSVHIDNRYGALTLYFFNNTFMVKTGNQCFVQVGSNASSVITLENNHCISDTGLYSISAPTTVVSTTNTTQTPTVATSQGYTASQTPYVYYPTLGGSTIGSGTNLTSSWPGGYSTNDTTYACTVAAGNVVSCPARTSVSRGIWDVGAYQYVSATNPSVSVKGNVRFQGNAR